MGHFAGAKCTFKRASIGFRPLAKTLLSSFRGGDLPHANPINLLKLGYSITNLQNISLHFSYDIYSQINSTELILCHIFKQTYHLNKSVLFNLPSLSFNESYDIYLTFFIILLFLRYKSPFFKINKWISKKRGNIYSKGIILKGSVLNDTN